MKTFHGWRTILSILLVTGSGCQKEKADSEGLSHVGEVPYYHFTDDDRRWLQHPAGTEWHFTNGRGGRRTYQVKQVLQHLRAARRARVVPGILAQPGELLNYYDDYTLRVSRTDTLAGGGELRFERGPVQDNPGDPSQLFVAGEWFAFVGNTNPLATFYHGFYRCGGLNFLPGPQLTAAFASVVVQGRSYSEVLVFSGLGAPAQGPYCQAPAPQSIQEVAYDRRAGVVRLTSVGGEVWERLP